MTNVSSIKAKPRLLIGVAIALLIFPIIKLCSAGNPYKDLTLLDLLTAYRVELEYPGLTIKEAAANLKTAEAAFAFVRDQTQYSGYFGRRQTSENMLRTRVGNSQDRAFLLANLLDEMGWEVSVHGTNREGLLPQTGSFKIDRESAVLKEISQRIGYKVEDQASAIADMQNALRMEGEKLSKKVDDTWEVLSRHISYGDTWHPDDIPDSSRVFVLASKGGSEKLYYDPTYPELGMPDSYWDVSLDNPISETTVQLWKREPDGKDEVLLSWSGQTAGQEISLSYFPTQNPIGVLDGPPDPAAINVWTPILQVEGDSVAGRPFSTKGWSLGEDISRPTKEIVDLLPLDASEVTDMEIKNIDTDAYPKIQFQLAMKGTASGVLLPQQVIVKDAGNPVQVTANNFRPTGGSVLIVADVSGSMKDINAFEPMKEALNLFSKALSPERHVGLVSFALDPKIELPLAPLENGEKLRAAVENLVLGDYTDIGGALRSAAGMKGMAGGTVVFLTDGRDNVYGVGEDHILLLKQNDIRVHTIALGEDSDRQLMSRIAEETGGIFWEVDNPEKLKDAYEQFGRQISGYATLAYIAEVECSTSNPLCEPVSLSGETQAQNSPQQFDRQISVELKSSELRAQGQYREPKSEAGLSPMLYLTVDTGNHSSLNQSSEVHSFAYSARRDLIDLSHPDAGWALSGQTEIIVDHGRFAPSVTASSYISEWIDVLRLSEEVPTDQTAENNTRTSFEHVAIVNSLRTLTSHGSGTAAQLSPGPHVYLRRIGYQPGENGMQEVQTFDVVDRWRRSLGATNTQDSLRIDIALNLSEGWISGGENAVDALLSNRDMIKARHSEHNSPTLWAPVMFDFYEPSKNLFELTVESAPEWIWLADNTPHRLFGGYYLGDAAAPAKGANFKQLAKSFEKIDKLYELYADTAGKTAGLNSVQGTLLSQIASLKREENKLWCYSTLMMGHVNEAVADENAVLNEDPRKAKETSQKLCKMDYDPDEFGNKVWKNALDNIKGAAKSWAKGKARSAGNNIATSLGAGAVVDAIKNAEKAKGYHDKIINPAFHLAMSREAELSD